jgi:hypothetical protein
MVVGARIVHRSFTLSAIGLSALQDFEDALSVRTPFSPEAETGRDDEECGDENPKCAFVHVMLPEISLTLCCRRRTMDLIAPQVCEETSIELDVAAQRWRGWRC